VIQSSNRDSRSPALCQNHDSVGCRSKVQYHARTGVRQNTGSAKERHKTMKSRSPRSAFSPQPFDGVVAIVCVALLAFYSPVVLAQQAEPATSSPEQAPKIPNDHLDSLVAPIALYPDPLLSQVLVASTYPLEIIQLQQWLVKHKDLKTTLWWQRWRRRIGTQASRAWQRFRMQ